MVLSWSRPRSGWPRLRARRMLTDLQQQLDNPAVWLILLTAVVVYALLLDLLLARRRDAAWRHRCSLWAPGLRTMLGALPLLGLYGTVVGLMDTFAQMALDYGFNPETLATGGIASAMYSTQLGLLLVIPGWLALAWLQGRRRTAQVEALRSGRAARAAEATS